MSSSRSRRTWRASQCRAGMTGFVKKLGPAIKLFVDERRQRVSPVRLPLLSPMLGFSPCGHPTGLASDNQCILSILCLSKVHIYNLSGRTGVSGVHCLQPKAG